MDYKWIWLKKKKKKEKDEYYKVSVNDIPKIKNLHLWATVHCASASVTQQLMLWFWCAEIASIVSHSCSLSVTAKLGLISRAQVWFELYLGHLLPDGQYTHLSMFAFAPNHRVYTALDLTLQKLIYLTSVCLYTEHRTSIIKFQIIHIVVRAT